MLPDNNLKSRELFKPRITKFNISWNKKANFKFFLNTVEIGFIAENLHIFYKHTLTRKSILTPTKNHL